MPTLTARRSTVLIALACLLSLGFQRDTPPLNPSVRSVIAHGARGDGLADDTASLQATIDSFSAPNSTGVVEIPPGVYRLTKPLVYSGDYSYGLTIRGGGSAAGPSGTVLLYDGPPGEAVISLRGCTSTTIERLSIQGNGKAWCGVAVNYGDRSKVGTSGIFLDRLYIEGTVGQFGSAVAIGYDAKGNRDELQCDRVVISNSLFAGHDTTRYGLLTGIANCKNFAVRDCGFTKFQTGIKFGGSGYLIVDGFAGGGNTVADFEASTANLEIRAGNSEFSTRMLTGSTGANPGSVTISNFSWASDKVPNDQVIISYQGTLDIRNSHFWNDTRSDAAPTDAPPTAIPRIQLLETAGAMTSLSSSGNFFQRAQGQIPVVSWDGGPVRDSPVQSFGDFGGVGGQLVRLSGVLDYSDGRRWTRDGLYLSPERHWTDDGLYPGIGVKWVGAGGLIGRASGNLDWIDWVDRTNSTVVKSNRGRKK